MRLLIIALLTSLPALACAATNSGGWLVQSATDPLDDSQIITVAKDAEQGRNYLGEPVTLVLRCKSKRAQMFIAWHEYLGQEGLYVRYRIDKGVLQGGGWLSSNDQTATFYANPEGMISDLLKGSRLVARTTPYDSNTITAVFDLTGLRDAAEPLIKACVPHP